MPELDAELPNDLRAAIERLVQAKYVEESLYAGLDPSVRSLVFPQQELSGPWLPWEFFRLSFPFVDGFAKPCGAPIAAAVPTARTLGCSWRWRSKDLSEQERAELIAKLQCPARSIDDANYTWVRPLGLFLPHEGKNRVDFFRECGRSTIPAFVSSRDYPAASRLRIYVTQLSGRDEQWVVLDERWLQRAPPFFERIKDILKAYGVAPPSPWPAQYPDPANVGDALERARNRSHIGWPQNVVVDLLELRDSDADVLCSVADLDDVCLRPAFWWLSPSTGVLGLLVLYALHSWVTQANAISTLVALATGAAFGCMFLVQAPAIRARGRLLTAEARHARRASRVPGRAVVAREDIRS